MAKPKINEREIVDDLFRLGGVVAAWRNCEISDERASLDTLQTTLQTLATKVKRFIKEQYIDPERL